MGMGLFLLKMKHVYKILDPDILISSRLYIASMMQYHIRDGRNMTHEITHFEYLQPFFFLFKNNYCSQLELAAVIKPRT